MKMKIPMILTRCEFEKFVKAFAEPSVSSATFELVSNVKSIHFDSEYHELVCGTELESVTARVELK